MTQQINLYVREPEQQKGPAVKALLFLAVLAVLLGGYAYFLRGQAEIVEKRVAQARTQLTSDRAVVEAMRAQVATRMDPKRVAAELAALRTRATEAQDVIDRVKRGELGSLEGFSPQLVALARIGEPGVWLTGVRISSAGKAIEVEGRSLEAETVLRYASAVNRQVGPFGAQVTSLELTPAAVAGSTPTASKAVAFRLF